MTHQLLTMTDLGFLPQALVLHRSLRQTGADFRLRVLCLDEPARRVLEPLPGVETMPLADLEAADPALGSTRAERTWREYCWTATPSFVLHELERHPPAGPLTWVDADLMFFREPGRMTGALDGGSILLTPHRYYRVYPSAAPAEFLHEQYGRFNGGTDLPSGPTSRGSPPPGCGASGHWSGVTSAPSRALRQPALPPGLA